MTPVSCMGSSFCTCLITDIRIRRKNCLRKKFTSTQDCLRRSSELSRIDLVYSSVKGWHRDPRPSLGDFFTQLASTAEGLFERL
jgi:hypothetical protein